MTGKVYFTIFVCLCSCSFSGCGGVRSSYDQWVTAINASQTPLEISWICNRHGKGRVSYLAVSGRRGYFPRPVQKAAREELRVHKEGSSEVLVYPYQLPEVFFDAKELIYTIDESFRLHLEYKHNGKEGDDVLVIDPIIVNDQLRCPMHPDATVAVDGKCMVCGMDGIAPPDSEEEVAPVGRLQRIGE